MAYHHLLLHAAYLGTRSVLSIAHLADAVAREVAFGRTRVADSHGEVALLVSVHRHLSPVLRLVWHVVLRVLSRSVGVRVGIDAEHRVVAGLARPHPVVGLAAELAHRLRYGEHEAQVAEGAVCRSVVLVTLVERLDLEVERRILLVHLLDHLVLHLAEQLLALLVVHLVEAALGKHLCDVLLVHHEAHEHILVRQLLLEGLCVEAVEHVVVLHGRVRADSLKATVVIGEDESVGRHYDT